VNYHFKLVKTSDLQDKSELTFRCVIIVVPRSLSSTLDVHQTLQ